MRSTCLQLSALFEKKMSTRRHFSWEKTKELQRDVRFVEPGEYLCDVRAKSIGSPKRKTGRSLKKSGPRIPFNYVCLHLLAIHQSHLPDESFRNCPRIRAQHIGLSCIHPCKPRSPSRSAPVNLHALHSEACR